MKNCWSFIEVQIKFERVLSILRSKNEKDMAAIFAYGIHDYVNAKYQGNFNYPKEWIDEADRIEKWISETNVVKGIKGHAKFE